MRKLKKRTIEVNEDDLTVVEIDVDKKLIEFYKKETGRSRVTAKGLRNFVNNLIKLHKF